MFNSEGRGAARPLSLSRSRSRLWIRGDSVPVTRGDRTAFITLRFRGVTGIRYDGADIDGEGEVDTGVTSSTAARDEADEDGRLLSPSAGFSPAEEELAGASNGSSRDDSGGIGRGEVYGDSAGMRIAGQACGLGGSGGGGTGG